MQLSGKYDFYGFFFFFSVKDYEVAKEMKRHVVVVTICAENND